MRSRDLPISRSARYAAPAGNTPHDRGDHVVWDAPGCRLAWHAHRLELDAPPAELGPWFARWDEAHAGKGLGRAFLAWETALDVPRPALPERFAPAELLGLVHDGPAPSVPPPALPIALASAAQLGAVARGEAAQEPSFGPGYVGYLEWLYPALAARGGRTWAAWDGERPVAALTVLRGGDEARFQEVWTDRAYRRRGLAAALLAAALREGGRHLLATDAGSDALRLYLRLGFRPISRLIEVSRAEE